MPSPASTAIVSRAPRLRISLLASGSKGNSLYLSAGKTQLLVDAGFSGKELERRMQARDISPNDLKAILVTHEHRDHLTGVGVLARRYNLPVYINDDTLTAANTANSLGSLHTVHRFECGKPFQLESLTIHPFGVSHDAADPAGFTIAYDGIKVGIATDLGVATERVRYHLQNCNLLVLEANHDPDMLLKGPYPWPLKQRIKGRSGHLSNLESRNLLASIRHESLQQVILAHLSEQNNTPELALTTVSEALGRGVTRITVATQEHGSEMVSL